MSKEFTYHQRKTTDSYRKGWERAFSGNSVEAENEPFSTNNCADQSEADLLNHIYGIEKRKLAETTEQKQPYSAIPSKE